MTGPYRGACTTGGAGTGDPSRDQLFFYDGATTGAVGGPVGAGNLTRQREWLLAGSTAHTDEQFTFDAYGRMLTATDPNGNTTSLGYDTLGRLTMVANPGDSLASPSVSYGYSLDAAKAAASKIKTTTKLPGGTVTSVNLVEELGQHRQIHTLAADGSGNTVVIAARYDELGNQTALTQPMTSTAGLGAAPVQMHRDTVQETRTVHDELGRPETVAYWSTTSQQWQTSYAYTGLTTTITPPAGGVPTVTTTDLTERVLTRTEGTTALTATTTYGYDVQDRVTLLTYPDGTLATYEYDNPGRRTRSTDPATGVSTTSYDNNGNPLVATRASGQQITNTYDSLNRPLSITGAPNTVSTPVPLATYTYDTAIGGKGHPAAATTHTATGDFTTATAAYNQHGAPTQTSHTYPTPGTGTPTTLTYTTTYDTTGRVSSATLPSVGGLPAETLTYGYADTSTGLPTTMAGQRTYVSATNYLPDGTIAGRTIGSTTSGSSLTSAYTWSPTTRRLVQVATTSALNGASTAAVVNDSYTWDQAGNLTKVTDTLPTVDVNTCHGYDGLNRLTHSWTTTATTCTDSDTQAAGVGGYNTRWAHTIGGNISTVNRAGTTTTYGYGDTTRRPHAATSTTDGTTATTYSYDTDGRQATKDTTTGGATESTDYTWDLLGHLTAVTTTAPASSTGDITTLLHAPDGTRLSRTTPNGATTIYLPNTEITYPVPGTPTGTRYYTHGGQTTAIRTNTTITWQTTDRQGTTQTQLPDTTTAPTRIHTDPYGQPTAGTPATDRSFLGKTTDPTTGLTHLGHRHYDTTLARFLTPDPLTVTTTSQSPNPYTYANNNPVAYTDPTGLMPMWVDGQFYHSKRGPSAPKRKPRAGIQKTISTLVKPGQRTQDITRPTPRTQPGASRSGQRNVINFQHLCQCGLSFNGDSGGGGGAAITQGTEHNPIGPLATALTFASPVADALSCEVNVLCILAAFIPGPNFIRGVDDLAANSARKSDNVGAPCAVNSFTGTTLVLMADGTKKPIKDVELGD